MPNWLSYRQSKEVVELTQKSKGRQGKGRSMKTYQNKINHLKKQYRKLFNSSKKQKSHFYLDYPTEESYMKNFKLKQANINK